MTGSLSSTAPATACSPGRVVIPPCRGIAASAFKARPLPEADAWAAAILGLWRQAAFREERTAAIELLKLLRCSRWIERRRIPLVEELVVTGGWWDYVDGVAGRAIGTMLAARPQPTKTLRGWARSDNVWKRRTAILAQLRSRQATDRKLPADVIEPSIGEREYFLRKASGGRCVSSRRPTPAVCSSSSPRTGASPASTGARR